MVVLVVCFGEIASLMWWNWPHTERKETLCRVGGVEATEPSVFVGAVVHRAVAFELFATFRIMTSRGVLPVTSATQRERARPPRSTMVSTANFRLDDLVLAT